jgi:hypothetical protein
MLRPGRLAVLQPAAAPNRPGGAQRNPRPIRRHAMVRNDGGSGSGTRIRSSVIRAAVSCRRQQSFRRRCPADGWAKRPDGPRAGLWLLRHDRAPEADIRLRAGAMERGASPDQTRSHNSLAGETLGHHRVARLDRIVQAARPRFARRLGFSRSRSCWHQPMSGRFSAPARPGSGHRLAALECRRKPPVRIGHPTPLPEDFGHTAQQAWGAARHGGPPEVPSHQRRWRLPWSHPDAPTNAATILAFPKCSSRGISPRS